MKNPTGARMLTQAARADEAARAARARADEAARAARARVIGGVRRKACPQCRAGAYGPCQIDPAGDHLARWLAAYSAGRIRRADLIEVIRNMVVISASQIIEVAA
jgi:hypothetical protein